MSMLPSSSSSFSDNSFDYLFKVLLVGDSGVGKSSLLLRFTTDEFDESTTPTIGVDFRLKFITVQDQRVKLTIWDTAGQERFRTLTSSYYRGAQAIIFAYDVSRRETFDSIGEIWMKEVEMYSTVSGAVKAIIGNKLDLDSNREVSRAEGQQLAKKFGCLFVETSAKANVAVSQAFEELVQKILETPDLVSSTGAGGMKLGKGSTTQTSSCCS